MIEYNGKQVTIMACSRCNINCEHCYISYKGNRSSSELKQIVNNLSKKYKVEINGAEILTDLGYLESYPIANQDFLMTNGLAIYNDPEILDKLKKYGIKKIFMSYHYGIQDELSSVNMRQLEQNIETIQTKGFKIRLYTTITSKNYKLAHEIIENAKKYGVYSIRFTNYIKQGNALNLNDSNILSENEIKLFLNDLNNERLKNDINELKIARCGTFGNVATQNFNCYAGIDNIVLTPDNNVYPCIFLAKPGYEIGYYDGNKILLFEKIKNDGSECIVKEICNKNNNKIFIKTMGGKK